jgi:GAF domain-containing protein
LIEPDRIKALQRYYIMDSFPDPAFERLTDMAAQLFEMPTAVISLVDSDRVWFKSHLGTKTKEVPRTQSFCAQAILGAEVLVVPDAREDSRFADMPMVKAEGGYRFYAGAPLRSLDRYHLGALCVLDTKPRKDWTKFQSRILAELRRMTMGRRKVSEAHPKGLERPTTLRLAWAGSQ